MNDFSKEVLAGADPKKRVNSVTPTDKNSTASAFLVNHIWIARSIICA
jgi:hypothetical protein